MSEDEKQPMVGALSVLRLAAVVHFVLWMFYTPSDDSTFLAKRWRWFFSWGLSQVGFLVVISGFTLGYNYALYVNSMDKKEYFVKRVSRIPLVIAAAVLPAYGAPEASVGNWENFKRFVLTPFGIQGWVPDHLFSQNTPLWAVSVFVFLHLLFPFLLKALDTMQQMERRAKIGIIVGLWVLSYLLVVFLANADTKHDAWTTASPFLYLPTFVMGMMTGELFVNRAPYEDSAGEQIMARFAGTLSLVVMLAFYFFVPTFQFWNNRQNWQTWFFYWNHVGTLAGLQCFTLFWLGNGKDILGMLLNLKPIWFLGNVAPCMFLFCHPAWIFAHKFKSNVDLCFWITLIVLTIFTHFILDLPFYTWAVATYRKSKPSEL